MLISQGRSGRPNSAANPLRRPINSAAGRPEYIVRRLLIFLYSWLWNGKFLGVTTRFVPAGREGCIVGGEKDDLKARRAARDRNRTGAGNLNEPRGSISVMKALSFSLDPVISKTKLSVVESTTRARKMSATGATRCASRLCPRP